MGRPSAQGSAHAYLFLVVHMHLSQELPWMHHFLAVRQVQLLRIAVPLPELHIGCVPVPLHKGVQLARGDVDAQPHHLAHPQLQALAALAMPEVALAALDLHSAHAQTV